VTAEIDRLGSYTLAPAMPAGTITWTVEGVTVTDPNTDRARTRVRLQSSALTANTGAMAGGTLVHIFSLAPLSIDSGVAVLFGDAVTPDLDSATPGVQMIADPDGTLHVEYEYTGVPTAVRIFSFSDLGTATSDQVIQVVQP